MAKTILKRVAELDNRGIRDKRDVWRLCQGLKAEIETLKKELNGVKAENIKTQEIIKQHRTVLTELTVIKDGPLVMVAG